MINRMIRKSENAVTAILLLVVMTGLAGCRSEPPPAIEGENMAGAWVLYDVQKRTGVKSENGTLRLSLVGVEKREGALYNWYEFVEQFDAGRVVTRFLALPAPEYNPVTEFNFWNTDVREVIIQRDQDGARQANETQLRRYAPVFLQARETIRFGNREDLDPPKIEELGNQEIALKDLSLSCRHILVTRNFQSQINLGFLHMVDVTQSHTELWLNDDIPLTGIARATHDSYTISENRKNPAAETREPLDYKIEIRVQEYGLNGAVTAILGQAVAMELPKFPFLKDSKPPDSVSP